ncbi:hypothetical protein ZWY2020_042385 [Hordeum vulgare]|nr:hypothetical protein ZWY2020_042385 [Hordeum vulgare]
MIGDCPYEPSEASIQWSVVTASAVDMSAASEGGGARGRPPVAVRQNRDRPVGLLTGCVSRRAVDVSPMAAVRRFPIRRGSGASMVIQGAQCNCANP